MHEGCFFLGGGYAWWYPPLAHVRLSNKCLSKKNVKKNAKWKPVLMSTAECVTLSPCPPICRPCRESDSAMAKSQILPLGQVMCGPPLALQTKCGPVDK